MPSPSRQLTRPAPREYLVSLSRGGRVQKLVWNPRRPLTLGHPARWRLARLPQGIFAFPVDGPESAAVPIPPHAIHHGTAVSLDLDTWGSNDWQVTLTELKPLTPPYAPDQQPSEHARASHEYFLYSGFDANVMGQSHVGASFRIHVERRPVFSYAFTFPGHVVTPSQEGMWLEMPDGTLRDLPVDRPSPLSDDEWLRGTLRWGRHWWRATPVPVLDDMAMVEEPRRARGDGVRIARAAQHVLAMLAALACFFLFIAPRRPASTKPRQPPVEVRLKAPKWLPPVEKAPEPTTAQKPPAALTPERGAGPREIPPAAPAAEPPKPATTGPSAASEAGRPKPSAREASEAPDGAEKGYLQGETEVVQLEEETEAAAPREVIPILDDPRPRRNHTRRPGERRGGRRTAFAETLEITGPGAVDREDFERTLERHLGSFQDCYANLLARDPAAQGVVKMQWTVQRDGRATDVKAAESEIKDEKLLQCVTAEISRIGFPRPRRGEVTVKYPLVFATGY